jgi:GNAT superfamily N-acetyltransferase
MNTERVPHDAPPTPPLIRQLRSGEEPEAATVFQEAVFANWRRPKPPLWASDDDRHRGHRLATGDLQRMHAEHADLILVAEQDSQLAGIAATTIRDHHAHIVYLFVLPEFQGGGIGKALVEETRNAVGRHGASLISLTASDDRRAWQRYLRLGLIPGAPIISMSATEPRISTSTFADGLVESRVDAINDDQLATLDSLDRQIKGASRRIDRLAWLADGAHETLVYDTNAPDMPLGAYVVSRDHEQCRIGPVLAVDTAQVGAILERAFMTARHLCEGATTPWKVDVPAQNRRAIEPLLDAGFQPRNLLPWFSNQPIGQWDRYILRNEDLL